MDNPRPSPAPGQVWSAASPRGRRYIRIVGANCDPNDGAVESIEVDTTGPVLMTKLAAGEMPHAYMYEAGRV
jgi:hypothetical protein